jgi:hypothetical protein
MHLDFSRFENPIRRADGLRRAPGFHNVFSNQKDGVSIDA